MIEDDAEAAASTAAIERYADLAEYLVAARDDASETGSNGSQSETPNVSRLMTVIDADESELVCDDGEVADESSSDFVLPEGWFP